MDVVEYGRAWYWLMMDLARGTNPILAPLPPRKPRPHSPIGLTVVELEISHHFHYRWCHVGHLGHSYRVGADAPDGDRHFRRFLLRPDAGACETNDATSGPHEMSGHERAHGGYDD